jgi:protein-tyrosine phosphatase
VSVILFVCTGNLCRSPMATGLLREQLAEAGLEGRYLVRSAGVWAVEGRPASGNAIAVMAERGIDISDHVAHTVTASDMAEADLILGMSREHAEILKSTWPQYSWKIHRLSEMSGKRRDIRDPYQGPIEEYRVCADTLSDYLGKGFEQILEKA